ncbi:MAG: GGDEF domain protein [Idiomarinaceae bacterium HL-53]|nr:MAG: GGDEF domain protein [Idiomarinaceae bacterium HL-53]CUS48025.1 PAS domain S-box-containing protein/diguanylate cyclase (GGDEF) domain-containing protein [Idiomarinaceae bacterium HL-53]
MADLQQQLISEKALRAVMDEVGAFIYIKDRDGRYLYANSQVQQLFGAPLEEIIGETDETFFDLDISNELRETDQRVMQEGLVQECEERNYVRGTDEMRIYWSVKKPLFNEQKEIIGMYGISTDITDRKRIERELHEQNEFLNIVMNNIESSIYMIDQDNNLRYANRRLAERFNVPEGKLKGMPISEIVDEEALQLITENNQKVFETRQADRFKERAIDPSGREQVFWSVKVPHTLATGEQVIIGFSTEMTDIFELQEKLRKQTSQDELTKLYNRRYFFTEGEKQLLTAKHNEEESCLLVIDLDYFKEINDEYGHPAGDRVLIEVAERLAQTVRKSDLLARVGGEEFALFLPNTPKEKALELAEKLRASMSSQPVSVEEGVKIRVTLSAGVHADPTSNNTFADIYRIADKLLYEAKSQGRNQVCS